MVRPVRARDVNVLTIAVCVNVSGLSRVGCCCSQAMMRSARAVPNKLFGQEPAFLHRAYGTPIDCLVITFPSLAFCPGRSGEGRIPPLVERSRLGQDHPGDPGHLGCQRDDDLVGVHPRSKLVEPAAESVSRSIEMHDARSRAVDQQSTQIAASPLADAEKFRLARLSNARAGTRPEPGRHVAGLAELPGIASGREQCGRCQAVRYRERHEPPRRIVASGNRFDLRVYLPDALLEPLRSSKSSCEQPAHRRRQIVCLVPEHTRQIELEDAGALADRDAVFEAERRIWQIRRVRLGPSGPGRDAAPADRPVRRS